MQDMHNSHMLEDIKYTQNRLQLQSSQFFSLEQEMSKISLNTKQNSITYSLNYLKNLIISKISKIIYTIKKTVETKELNKYIDYIQQDFQRCFDMKLKIIEEKLKRREAQNKLIIYITQEVVELKRQLYLTQEDTDSLATSLREKCSLLKILQNQTCLTFQAKNDSDDAIW